LKAHAGVGVGICGRGVLGLIVVRDPGMKSLGLASGEGGAEAGRVDGAKAMGSRNRKRLAGGAKPQAESARFCLRLPNIYRTIAAGSQVLRWG
jgi:hypothetical protein